MGSLPFVALANVTPTFVDAAPQMDMHLVFSSLSLSLIVGPDARPVSTLHPDARRARQVFPT